MKIYICGNRENVCLFYEKERQLIEEGHIPINPLRVMDALPREINNSDFTVIAFEMIRVCEGIYLLDGWENDLLARLEYAQAQRVEKEILK